MFGAGYVTQAEWRLHLSEWVCAGRIARHASLRVLQTGIQLRAYVPVAASAPPRTLWKYLVPMMIGLVLWFIPPPSGLPLKAWHMFAVFVATTTGIITAPLPMSAVAILGRPSVRSPR